jgi:hypothetical protein
MTSSKRHGLVLDFPGAPDQPHTVAPMPFLFRTDEPFEVGDDHPISLADARKLDKDPGCPLKLVDIPDKAAARGRED